MELSAWNRYSGLEPLPVYLIGKLREFNVTWKVVICLSVCGRVAISRLLTF